METSTLDKKINSFISEMKLDAKKVDKIFCTQLNSSINTIKELFNELYCNHPEHDFYLDKLINVIVTSYAERDAVYKKRDKAKASNWFLSNQLVGMSLYVDRFCGSITQLQTKLDYFKKLGVNLLHLMPLMESPKGESDGGYAVSNFRKVDQRFGTITDLGVLEKEMSKLEMYLMLDIVLNHTSHKHEWAEKAKQGEKKYQDYFYMFDSRDIPNEFEKNMPDVFPQAAPGNFTFVPECNKWVMTVFHNYQWDLNYTNPAVFIEMLDTVFFYANLGVDVLRIDAPAFIWKQLGTNCQNLPKAHTILQLIKQCVLTATPGMALLGEAIVAPNEIMKYFGEGNYTAKECDFAYNATHMALQWDALATADTKVMLNAQHQILQKPYGTSWITYTRCHDDIGLAYDDYMIENAGYNAYEHRRYLKNYYTGMHEGSPAKGALFSVNPKTQDARISGSLASLCGLENAIDNDDDVAINKSIKKILLMQAHSFFIGGVPMLFYGDEVGYTNDYTYLNDPSKNYDNRWMHRPIISWEKNLKAQESGTLENRVFEGTKRIIEIRKSSEVFGDYKNIIWLHPHNKHVAGYLRSFNNKKIYCLFNFSNSRQNLQWLAFKQHGTTPTALKEHWQQKNYKLGENHEYFILEPYGFYILESS